jgi:hypothetical protein
MPIRIHQVVLASLMTLSVGKADIVFSNLTGVNSGGIVICGVTPCSAFGSGIPQTLAEQFTPSADYVFGDAIVEIGDSFSSDENVNVYLAADSSGLPGSFIEQIGFGLSPSAQNTITANSIATPIQLTSGTPYWLVVTPADSNTAVTWDDGGSAFVETAFSPTADGMSDWRLDGPSSGQMEIDGTPGLVTATPEPRLLVFATCGLLIIGAGLRRNRA